MQIKYNLKLMEVKPPYITFIDKPSFTPTYSPREMLVYGVFGGAYFLKDILHIPTEIRNKVFEGISTIRYAAKFPNKNKNLYGVLAGTSYENWLIKGWINEDDPNGWFEWYIKFYYGRRHPDDDRQIARFRSLVSRHWGALQSKVYKKTTVGDWAEGLVGLHGDRVSPVICQTLLQWGWNFIIKPNFK